MFQTEELLNALYCPLANLTALTILKRTSECQSEPDRICLDLNFAESAARGSLPWHLCRLLQKTPNKSLCRSINYIAAPAIKQGYYQGAARRPGKAPAPNQRPL